MKSFQKNQLAFTHYLRTSTAFPEKRNISIYRDLVYKRISGLIGDSFPITKNIIADDEWQAMIRDFIAKHRSQTPYFLEICQEFLVYLMNERQPLESDHNILLELAHFEWIQLALDVADTDMLEQHSSTPTENVEWQASPLAAGLTYSYPVHLADECYIPNTAQPVHIIAYRDRSDTVNTLITDAFNLRVFQLLQENRNINCFQLHEVISRELSNHHITITPSKLLSVISELAQREIVFAKNSSSENS